ncbi:MAG: hypothetical protein JNL70_22905 [Saprospiraceae bacterium]|nr:hypothetical protein [Saprospiraceae bacterium]
MVEVFKTNVQTQEQADGIIEHLLVLFPNSKIGFDLEDCDKVLRVESDFFSMIELETALQTLDFQYENLI